MNPSLSESQITSITPVEMVPSTTKHAPQFVPISQSGTFRFPPNTINDKNEQNNEGTIVIDHDLKSSSGQDVVILPQTELKNDMANQDIKVEPLESKSKVEKDDWTTVSDDEADSGPEIVEMIDSKDDSDGDGFHLSNDVNREYNKVLSFNL